MKKFILLVLGIFLLTGCANDASEEEKEQLLNAFQEKRLIPNDLKLVGSSEIVSSYFDATPIYKNLDVYEKDGKYYSINFDKICMNATKETNDCDFVVEIYDHVEFDGIYETDDEKVKKYCVDERKKLITRRKYFIIEKMN